jgi:hypothetical protein
MSRLIDDAESVPWTAGLAAISNADAANTERSSRLDGVFMR